jgi:hypothetical protein
MGRFLCVGGRRLVVRVQGSGLKIENCKLKIGVIGQPQRVSHKFKKARGFFDGGGDFSSFSIPFDGRKMGEEANGEE